MFRRELLFVLAGTTVAGCVPEGPIQAANPSEIKVTRVAVSLSKPEWIDKTLATWKIGITRERLQADVTAALSREFVAASRGGTRPVAVQFSLATINLDSSVPELIKPVWVGIVSQIVGTLTVTDAKTGAVLFRKTVVGDDIPGEVTFGAAMRAQLDRRKSESQAYKDVVNGFAEDAVREVFTVEAARAS